MDLSVFTEKESIPTKEALQSFLGEKITWWEEIRNYAFEKYPKAFEEWNYPGKKYGWSFRVKDKKRAIIYFLPRDGFFKVAFVFGQKATDEIMKSEIRDKIKKELSSARVYAEGRGIGIPVMEESVLTDIKSLIDIKLKY